MQEAALTWRGPSGRFKRRSKPYSWCRPSRLPAAHPGVMPPRFLPHYRFQASRTPLWRCANLQHQSLLSQAQHVELPVKSKLAWRSFISWRCLVTQRTGNTEVSSHPGGDAERSNCRGPPVSQKRQGRSAVRLLCLPVSSFLQAIMVSLIILHLASSH